MPETTSVISREQDIMIRAFDYVVRKNRESSYQAAVVIGNAIQAISDTINLRPEYAKFFKKSFHHVPACFMKWMKKTFINLKLGKPAPKTNFNDLQSSDE